MNRLIFTNDTKPETGKRITFAARPVVDAAQFATSADAKDRTVEVKAIVYNALSDERPGGYKVRIVPGAAKFTDPTLALWHHSYANLLGSSENGSLTMKDGPDGITFTIKLPDTTLGRDVFTLLKDGYFGAKGAASFGVVPTETRWAKENGEDVLEFVSMLVDEVTLTPIGAFTETTAKVVEPPAPAPAPKAPSADDLARREEALRFDRLKVSIMGHLVEAASRAM